MFWIIRLCQLYLHTLPHYYPGQSTVHCSGHKQGTEMENDGEVEKQKTEGKRNH
jgi:hypothetical protein